jgi:cytochrome o ubiquinol oxidase operon protein cyoD
MSRKPAETSVWSYITGFVLCLLLTTASYYMVVHKSTTATNLLAVIVGLATVQVLIQVYYFLHLGRGPKPLYNVAFFAGTVAIIAFVVGGSLFIMSHLHYNMLPPADTAKQLAEGEAIPQVEGNKTGACQGTKANHQVIMLGSVVSPMQIQAELCDTISFTNQDSVSHQITFGTPASPTTYAGQATITIRKGKSETVTLNQTGTYSYYNPLNTKAIAKFTVTAR